MSGQAQGQKNILGGLSAPSFLASLPVCAGDPYLRSTKVATSSPALSAPSRYSRNAAVG
jgi:hypothetical protein